MKNLLLPTIFYAFILIYLIGLYRNGGFKILLTGSYFDSFKYCWGTSLFFFSNINILFYCAFCNHCHTMCITFSLSAVLIGAVIYLAHLVRQTVNSFNQIIIGNGFDLMAPFFSIPYFVLIYDITYAALNTGMGSLHAYESKMLIVLLYPFSVVLGELTSRIKTVRLGNQV